MRFWTRFNGDSRRKRTSRHNEVLTKVRYGEGPVEIVLLHFDDDRDGFGHHWPRIKYYGFEAHDPIWEFFSRHALGAK
jgi:hypothetical protein